MSISRGDRRGRRAAVALTGAVLVAGLAGCGSAAEDSARETADQFVSALAGDDAERACQLIAQDTVNMLESLRPEGCAKALPSLDLPHDPVTEVRAWGDGAQVRTAGDVLFLRELQSGWRVVAAGCTSVGENRPYECDLEGS